MQKAEGRILKDEIPSRSLSHQIALITMNECNTSIQQLLPASCPPMYQFTVLSALHPFQEINKLFGNTMLCVIWSVVVYFLKFLESCLWKCLFTTTTTTTTTKTKKRGAGSLVDFTYGWGRENLIPYSDVLVAMIEGQQKREIRYSFYYFVW